MRTLLLSLLLALLALPAVAQHEGHGNHQAMERPDPRTPQGENMQTPPTWTVRLDKPNDDVVIGADSTADIFFVNMTPGWHVATGPAGIFYHPASTAEGTYRAETMIHFFDPGQRNEAFGLFIGGTDLEGDNIAYDYFLIRNTGEFLIKRRAGSETSVIQDWTKHDAVQTYGPDTESSVPNTLAVEVGAENVDFYINGEQVASHPRDHLHTDGIVGLRVNHALNLHIADFKVE
jgi:hypothetical protein